MVFWCVSICVRTCLSFDKRAEREHKPFVLFTQKSLLFNSNIYILYIAKEKEITEGKDLQWGWSSPNDRPMPPMPPSLTRKII